MTKRQKRYKAYQRDIRLFLDKGCKYPGCFNKGTQLAHRCAQTVTNIKLFGFDFIYSNINLVTCCNQPEHNDYWNCGFNPAKSKKLYEFYLDHIDEFVATEKINLILEL